MCNGHIDEKLNFVFVVCECNILHECVLLCRAVINLVVPFMMGGYGSIRSRETNQLVYACI